MFVACKKNFNFLPLFDKLIFLGVIAPPVYMLYRFARWYLKQGIQVGSENENDASPFQQKGEPEVNG
jgi:hypothetical protein